MGDAASFAPLMPEASPQARLMRSSLSHAPKKRRVYIDKESDFAETPDERKDWLVLSSNESLQRHDCLVCIRVSAASQGSKHLYRQHMLPQHLCSRCLETFGSESELRQHSRASEPCQVNMETHIEGITYEQEKVLKSKRRTSKSGSNTAEEKWREIYSILFPDEAIPGAFCKTIGPEDPMKDTLSVVKRDLSDFVAQRLKEVSSELFPFSLDDPIPKITQIVSDGLDRFIPDTILTNSVSDYPASVHTERSSASSAFNFTPSGIPSPMSNSSRRQIGSPSSFQSMLSSHRSAFDPYLTPSTDPEPKHVSFIHSPDGRLDSSHVPSEETNEHAAEPSLPSAWGDNTDYQIDGLFDFDL